MTEKNGTVGPKQTGSLYTPAGFYLLRTPVLPAAFYLRLSSTGHLPLAATSTTSETDYSVLKADFFQLLRELVEDPQIRLAVAVASPSLQYGIANLRAGKASRGQAEQTYKGLLRYLIRMSTRPTPFGLFSGVALGKFAEQTTVQLASPVVASLRTRADMSWLLALIQKLEEQREVVSQLRVRANQMAYLAGGRICLPRADIYGQQDKRAISLRATPVVLKTLALALNGLPYAELVAVLQQAYPQTASQQIENLLWQLWEHHFLLSELHPPLIEAQPARYVAAQLASVQGIDQVKTGIETILRQSLELDQGGVTAPTSLLEMLGKSQAQLVTEEKGWPQIQIDTALSLQAAGCHQDIAEAAARAAELLLRMTPLPQGLPHIQEYQLHFLEKYGSGAEVPLLDLLSPENGLDAPTGYFQPSRTYPLPLLLTPAEQSKWERLLQQIVARAIHHQQYEIELTEQLVAQLERGAQPGGQGPDSLEIYVQVQATSREALDRGEWSIAIGPNCGSESAGRTFGRFFDLFGEEAQETLQQLAAREEALHPEALFAELSYQPPRAKVANVTIHPPLYAYEIAVGTTPSVPSDHVIALSDLVVGIRDGRFYVRSLSLGKQVIVKQSHMLNMLQAPNVCRFLLEIGQGGRPLLSGFHWGNAADSPFLPRLVWHVGASATLVLSPAQWSVSAEMLQLEKTAESSLKRFQRLQDWRQSWRVPRYVYLTEADNRLLLDLEHPVMSEELYRALDKTGEQGLLILQECFPDFAHLPVHDEQERAYFAEIVIPLLRTNVPAASKALVGTKPSASFLPPRAVTREERLFLPGDPWVYFKLYTASSQQNALIAHPLRSLIQTLQAQNLVDDWFFIRYRDPEPHVRLRVHVSESADLPSVWQTMLHWSQQLCRQGVLQRYSIESYEREVERYGGPLAIELLERVFCLDSTITSSLLAAQQEHRLTLDPLEIAVFSLDHFFAGWGYSFNARLHWLEQRTEKYAWSTEYRPLRKRYCELLAPHINATDSEEARQRELMLARFAPYKATLSELGKQVRELERTQKLWVSEGDLLGSLAHMHKIRLLDLDRRKEEQIYAFWRHTLQSIRLRPDAPEETKH